ncbi:ADP-ribosyltransferase [Corynebacterium segmentosum]
MTWLSTEFKSWGYMSTSTHSVPDFGPIEMRLTVPKGTRAVYLGWDGSEDESTALSRYPQEEELLLGRQIRYRIKDISNESDTTVVKCPRFCSV